MKKCKMCGGRFIPHPTARKGIYCGVPCRQKGNSASTAKRRGDILRGRGEGKTYTKREGRHEHRIVAEKKIGRALRLGEVVHHIDGNKKNNDPKNLVVITQSEHARGHFIEYHANRRARKSGR